MTHRYRSYADRVGIKSSLKETRSFSATQLLTSGVDLNTVAGRLGHAKGSTTLQYYAHFTRPADQRAAGVIPAQLDQLRKKLTLRGLFRKLPGQRGAGQGPPLVLGPAVRCRPGLQRGAQLLELSFIQPARAPVRSPGGQGLLPAGPPGAAPLVRRLRADPQ